MTLEYAPGVYYLQRNSGSCAAQNSSAKLNTTAQNKSQIDIMEKKFYFFKTLKIDKNENRLRPLPGQVDENGRPILSALNVMGGQEIRKEYPIGTYFGSTLCEIRTGKATNFYAAGDIFPVGIPNGQYKKTSHTPSKEMSKAWNEYRLNNPEEQEETLFDQNGKTKTPSNLLAQIKLDPNYACPTIKNEGFYVKQTDWNMIVRNIIKRKNTMMIGPTGTGKTELVILACRKLEIPCYVFDMGSMVDPITGLLGTHRLENGKSIFDYARFSEVIKTRCVVLLDELSRAPATTNNILFPCLDSRRELPIEMAGGNGLRNIPLHPKCVFFATANVGADYTGTMTLDRALVDRFMPLELSYMPETQESELLVKRCKIGNAQAIQISTIAKDIRDLYEEEELSSSISTRHTIDVAELVADGWEMIDALTQVILPLFSNEGKENSERQKVKMLMCKY